MSRFLAQENVRHFKAAEDGQKARSQQEGVPTVEIKIVGTVANDSLQEELEARYGVGFAQWVIDGLNKSRNKH